MDKSMKIPMNLQLFAESGGDPTGGDPGSGAAGNQQNTNNQQAGQPFSLIMKSWLILLLESSLPQRKVS